MNKILANKEVKMRAVGFQYQCVWKCVCILSIWNRMSAAELYLVHTVDTFISAALEMHARYVSFISLSSE